MDSASAMQDLVVAVSPCGAVQPSPRIVTAAMRGGGLGVLDLAGGDWHALQALGRAAAWSTAPIGVRVPVGCAASMADVERAAAGGVNLAVLTAGAPWPVADAASRFRVLVEVTSRAQARAAAAAGAHGLIARGMESGGPVGELSSFVLLQQLCDDALALPIWVAGGIGARTAVACVVGGATGVVLDSQLGLMPESDLPDVVRNLLWRMDGTETVLVDQQRGTPCRPGDGDSDLLPIGQDGVLAARFAARWPNTVAAVRGVRSAILDGITDRASGGVLAPGGSLAATLGVRIPVAQGPMTRVSDQTAFAAAVAADGALPFLALALADAASARRMLRDAAKTLAGRRWGVGVLGFVPDELRAAQIEAILETGPSCAIIAGGRPAQAKILERAGIATFLHVPSPVLLGQFLRAGVRRFVFEGAECGGHIGPRASFPLWEAQLAVLDEYLCGEPADAGEQVQVFFAGGIHDARSAAMVATLAAPLTGRGAHIGVLMGTAYLFTREATEHGAIQPLFQRNVLAAQETALLETSPGHAIRCLPSDFVDEFHRRRAELQSSGADSREAWRQLELLTVGRLRLASKGRRRDGGAVVDVDEATQAAEGLYMVGQAAVLRDAPTTVAALHRDVTTGARDFHTSRLDALRTQLAPARADDVPPAPLDIAVVGMACTFAGSADLHGFWRTVLSGDSAISEVAAERWDPSVYYSPDGAGETGPRSTSKWGGFIGPTPIDPIRFGIPPAALGSIDPAQLLALEVASATLVDAGYPHDTPGAEHSRTGVVFGAQLGADGVWASMTRVVLPAYLGEVPAALAEQLPVITEDTFPGTLPNVIAGRIANRLDLGGTNYTVDAACAASLAAVNVACNELVTGAVDLMLCGAVDLHNSINDFIMFSSVHALSPTGQTRTFDSAADGIVLGEGAACLALKRLADATRDGDRIYAVIKGVGAASDGRALGLTAPRPAGQRSALRRAYRQAGVSPRDVGVVEAHGTGTVVGDRTELESLTEVFTEAGAHIGGCVLGSVKSQIGHTKCAAGLAGMIKAVLAIYTGVQPPTINLTRPNAAWDSQRSPFAFLTRPRPWAAPAAERIAGVSAFGFGGTNFHAVIAGHADTPEPRYAGNDWPAELFCFRGADRAATHEAVRRLAATLAVPSRTPSPLRLRDLAASMARTDDRRVGPVRVAVVARDTDELVILLRRALAGEHDPGAGLVQPPPGPWASPPAVAFLFPGQGSQRPGALADLFVGFPELHHYLRLGRRWVEALFPPAAFDADREREQHDQVRDTMVAQPALGICGLAVDDLLRRSGVHPDLVAGHSYGELVALCTAGVVDPATLLDLSHERATEIIAAAGDDPGAMAAVSGTAEQVGAALSGADLAGHVVLANHNAPSQVVISGPTSALKAAITVLRDAGLAARQLPVACAFHSPIVASAGPRFAQTLAHQPVAAPRVPVWSNYTAAPYPDDPARIRAELAAQIAAPVRFADQIEAMYDAGARIFVEAGPGNTLTRLVRAVLGDRPHLAVACDGPPGQGLRAFLSALAELACAGVPVDAGWLLHGRADPDVAAADGDGRSRWTADGALVRDSDGACVPGGLTPARPITLQASIGGNATAAPVNREALLTDYLRSSRELVAAHREVMLAYLGEPIGDWHAGRVGADDVARPSVPVPASLVAGEPEQTTTPVAAQSGPALDLVGTVLAVISERTGYPIDLLGLDLDLEAELSIDSIKRAEVAGEVAARLGLSTNDTDSALEELVTARTVRAIVGWLHQRVTDPPPPDTSAEPAKESAATAGSVEMSGVVPSRLLPCQVRLDTHNATVSMLAGAHFLLTGEAAVAESLAERLRAHGGQARFAASFDDDQAGQLTGVDGLILLDGLSPTDRPLLPAIFPAVKHAITIGVRWLIAAAYQDGAGAAGLPGLFRTIDQEHPGVQARYVGLDRADSPQEIAERLLGELMLGSRVPAVSYRDGRRHGLALVPTDLGVPAGVSAVLDGVGRAETTAIGLDRDSVVILVGGARGITAAFARTLAAASGCRIELIGRTAIPDRPPADDIVAAADASALRAALVRRGATPLADIEHLVRDILAGREVATTLDELRTLDSQVRYHTLDVRDSSATSKLINDLYGEYGRIDGVIYGAGVIEDRLIVDKQPESFARVFDTKLGGAASVLDALADQGCTPRFVVLFGSLAAVAGSRGQCDYAAANDALDNLGARWAARTGNRCLTVHWGPWAPVGTHPGMVDVTLARRYARHGVGMISPREGVSSLLRELAWGEPGLTSVVYAAAQR